METKHTPGPWEYEGKTFDARHGFYPVTAKARSGCLASVDRHGKNDSEGEANAKLIAAAPDLLEAVIIVYSHLTSPMSVQMSKEKLAKLMLDAIKKATQ